MSGIDILVSCSSVYSGVPLHTTQKCLFFSILVWSCVLSLRLQNCIHVFMFHRVLLRVRMLYYLKAEILGEAADKAFEGTPAR